MPALGGPPVDTRRQATQPLHCTPLRSDFAELGGEWIKMIRDTNYPVEWYHSWYDIFFWGDVQHQYLQDINIPNVGKNPSIPTRRGIGKENSVDFTSRLSRLKHAKKHMNIHCKIIGASSIIQVSCLTSLKDRVVLQHLQPMFISFCTGSWHEKVSTSTIIKPVDPPFPEIGIIAMSHSQKAFLKKLTEINPTSGNVWKS